MRIWFRKSMLLVLALMLMVPSMVSANGEVTTTSGSADLRVVLGQKLGEHALLAVVAMQKGIDGSADFANVAAALGENTEELAGAIASVYGKEAGAAFKGQWEAHIGFFVDYVVATSKNDEAGRKAALAELADYRTDFSKFLAGANPNLDATVLANGLQMHVNQLVAAFDNYVAKDYDAAYASLREAYAHMFMTGAALSGAISTQFPETFTNGSSSQAAVDLRVVLGQKLGEHAALALIAMQKGINGAPDFGAAATALGGNTADLTAAITSVYGADAGAAFKGQWEAHIGFFVDYVVATSKKDEAGRKAALAELADYKKDFAAFLAGANPNLNASGLADGLQMHVDQLVAAFDSYVAKDYEGTYDAWREAYGHMFMTGDALSAAIVKQFNTKFGGKAESSMGSMPGHDMGNVEVSTGPLKVMLWLGNAEVMVDNAKVTVDSAPFLWKNTSYVPLRFLSEGIGATVNWNAKTGTVTVVNGSDVAEFWAGKDFMNYNGKRLEIGADVVIREGRTQVPIRFIAELFGWDVAYASNGEVTLTKK
jgi:hypothetical protein